MAEYSKERRDHALRLGVEGAVIEGKRLAALAGWIEVSRTALDQLLSARTYDKALDDCLRAHRIGFGDWEADEPEGLHYLQIRIAEKFDEVLALVESVDDAPGSTE